VPADTPVRVIVSPQYGAGDRTISNPTPLTGLAPCMTMPGQQCRQASVTVAIAPTGVGVISAVISDPVTPVP
jgi:galactitol-specific phosphotransferase system IIC component